MNTLLPHLLHTSNFILIGSDHIYRASPNSFKDFVQVLNGKPSNLDILTVANCAKSLLLSPHEISLSEILQIWEIRIVSLIILAIDGSVGVTFQNVQQEVKKFSTGLSVPVTMKTHISGIENGKIIIPYRLESLINWCRQGVALIDFYYKTVWDLRDGADLNLNLNSNRTPDKEPATDSIDHQSELTAIYWAILSALCSRGEKECILGFLEVTEYDIQDKDKVTEEMSKIESNDDKWISFANKYFANYLKWHLSQFKNAKEEYYPELKTLYQLWISDLGV